MNFLKHAAFALILGLGLSSTSFAREETDVESAKEYVEALTLQTVSLLANKDTTLPEKQQQVKLLLEENMAVDAIGRIVLGKPWRQMSDIQKEEYSKLFREYLLIKYSGLVGNYEGQQVDVTKSVRAGKSDVMVFTTISVAGKDGALVGWRVRTIEGKMKLLDVKIADLSMVQTERDQFQNVYQNSQIEGLLETLRTLVTKMKEQVASSEF